MFQSRYARRVRRRMVDYAHYLYQHRSELGYREYRPMRSFATPIFHVPKRATDCSESTAMIAHASGAPTPYVTLTPSGAEGYTGTMLDTLPHIPKRRSRRGDLAVFVHPDRPTGDHVVMLLQGGLFHRDPLIWSHGMPGVYETPISVEAGYHPGCRVVYLRSVPPRLKAA